MNISQAANDKGGISYGTYSTGREWENFESDGWSVMDENGGQIDHNGIYRASEIQGTYEISVQARADESVRSSAFVVVE